MARNSGCLGVAFRPPEKVPAPFMLLKDREESKERNIRSDSLAELRRPAFCYCEGQNQQGCRQLRQSVLVGICRL